MKEIIYKLDFIKIKNFFSTKDDIKRTGGKATDWEKIFAKGTFDKEVLTKIYKKHHSILNNPINNSIKKWAKDLRRHLIKDMQMEKKHMKTCSTSYIIRKMQIKIGYHYMRSIQKVSSYAI